MTTPKEHPSLARWREDTPGCAGRIHLNNAGASLVPRPVRSAVDRHLDLEDELGVEPAGRPAVDIKLALRAHGINTSSPTRDDAVIDMDAKGATTALRISPHYYNTTDEIETAVGVLGELLA